MVLSATMSEDSGATSRASKGQMLARDLVLSFSLIANQVLQACSESPQCIPKKSSVRVPAIKPTAESRAAATSFYSKLVL